jgi:hypothetical protein
VMDVADLATRAAGLEIVLGYQMMSHLPVVGEVIQQGVDTAPEQLFLHKSRRPGVFSEQLRYRFFRPHSIKSI